MNVHEEVAAIGLCEDKLLAYMNTTAPVHVPHAVGCWCYVHYEVLCREVSDSVAKGESEEVQTQLSQQAIVIAFLVGFEFAKQGNAYTECPCGQLEADNVEELTSGIWRQGFTGIDPEVPRQPEAPE